MDYKNSEMKVDQLVNYLNDKKINLSPAFQRGHVWKLNFRRKLLKNILDKKPIPAIFLYKEATGSKYSYNILDGKQRIESIILYIGNSRDDLRIVNWRDYFISAGSQRAQADFEVEAKQPATTFYNLDDATVRDFREYSIPTIEISLNEKDESSLSDIISLFIDINQQGVPVSRFNIVKALCIDSKLLKGVFSLIAVEQRRRSDLFYKMIDNDITRVLKKLRDVQAVLDPNFKVDKIWEHLLEICLFCQTGIHRKPVDILKGFINKNTFEGISLSGKTLRTISNTFTVLDLVYRKVNNQSPLFTDYTYFYPVVTALTKDGVLTRKNRKDIEAKLVLLGAALAESGRSQTTLVRKFVSKSKVHTTDVSSRIEREEMIVDLLNGPIINIKK